MTVSVVKLGGMIITPFLWVVNTQIGQVLPYADCAARTNWLAACAFGFALAGLAGTWLSYRADGGASSPTGIFLAKLSLYIGLAFVFVLLLQGAATVLLSPCQR